MPFRHHLLYRLLIFDVCATAALVWGLASGIVWPLFETDTSRISFIIVAVFLIGKASLIRRARKVSHLKNKLKRGESIKIKPVGFLAKHEHLSDLLEVVVVLGLAGTLIGLRMVIDGIDADIDYAVTIANLKAGFFVAINTSLVGIGAGLWLWHGRRSLHTATVTLLEDANG